MLPGGGIGTERIVRQAQASGLKVEMVEREVGPVNRTLLSATIALQGAASGELADEWEERCNGLPKARIAFITSGKTGLSVCIRLCCRRVRRLQKEISAMKPYGLPVRRAACQQDRVRGPCRSHPVRDECGSFRPTFTMAEQEAGNGTPVGETFVMDDGTGDDSGAGKLE